ncbi:MAG: hypothetical protein KAG61_06430, partial [Bacteriovoracaceae bacterium]|nr:hypothetical protein [Bacteriovoracaceae bacterium]
NMGLRQLPNPYSLEANSNVFLSNGFGVLLGAATYDSLNGEGEREIVLTLTVQNLGIQQTVSQIKTLQDALTSNSFDIIKQLGSVVSNFSYQSDSGIEILGGEDGSEYLTFSTTINVRYLDRGFIANC